MGRIGQMSLVLSAAIMFLAGCRSVKHLPVEIVRADSVYVDRWLRDSVYLHDSVFMYRWTQGDTVFVEKAVTKYAYKDRWRHDTVSVTRVDTIGVPYPVEKELTVWERLRLDTWYLLAAAITVLFLVVFVRKKE